MEIFEVTTTGQSKESTVHKLRALQQLNPSEKLSEEKSDGNANNARITQNKIEIAEIAEAAKKKKEAPLKLGRYRFQL